MDFEDVGMFHQKFGLDNVTYRPPQPRMIPDEVQEFRVNFLIEELEELQRAYAAADLPGIADALVDLVYVAMGTAHLHGIPWNEVWAEVQRANMQKERCRIDHIYEGDGGPCTHKECTGQPEWKHSSRGQSNDVVKPVNFRSPDIETVLRRFGWVPTTKIAKQPAPKVPPAPPVKAAK